MHVLYKTVQSLQEIFLSYWLFLLLACHQVLPFVYVCFFFVFF